MRVLFLESDHRFIFGLPLGFRDVGHKILISGPICSEKLHNVFNQFKPNLMVVLGWSQEHIEDKLEVISSMTLKYHVPLIYWATEDPTFFDYFSLPLVKKIMPNHIFTVSKDCIPKYEAHGFICSHLSFGYNPTLFHPASLTDIKKYSIGLVANAYPNVLTYEPSHYRKKSMEILLNPFLNKDIRVDIWGENWDKMAPYLGKTIPTEWLHASAHYLKTNDIYNQCDFLIGLQNYEEDVIAMRTYEILGSGGLLITTPHKALEEWLIPETDYLCISSDEELLEVYDFYRNHPSSRNLICKNGNKAVTAHCYRARAQTILEQCGFISSQNP